LSMVEKHTQGGRGGERPTFADSHTHIPDLSGELAFVIMVGCDVKECREVVADSKYCAVGIHPQNASEYTEEFEKWVLGCGGSSRKVGQSCDNGTQTPRIVAIGEIGLDYFHHADTKELQRTVFEKQILIADKMKLPIIIHTRNAIRDTLEILITHKSHIRHGLLFHCFSETAEDVKTIREHFDAYFAFGGGITYCEDASVLGVVPLGRMLLETDSPYLNPKQNGGKKVKNEPRNVRFVAEFIAGKLGLSVEEIAERTLANTKSFFKIQ